MTIVEQMAKQMIDYLHDDCGWPELDHDTEADLVEMINLYVVPVIDVQLLKTQKINALMEKREAIDAELAKLHRQ